MQVTIEEAYAEACRVIGEQIVTQRLLARAEQPEPQPCCPGPAGHHEPGCPKGQ